MHKEDTKKFYRNPGITLLHRTHSIDKRTEQSFCGYQVRGTERKVSHFLYWDDLKLQSRNENGLNNGIKIKQTISKNINMNFGLQKCARVYLKRGSVQNKMRIESTFVNDIEDLDPRKA